MSRLALLVVWVLLLAGCTGGEQKPEAAPSASPTSPTARPTTAEPAPRPPASACYRLRYDDAVAPTTARRPVPCSRPHTSATFAVGTLLTDFEGHLLTVDSERVQAQPARTCPQKLVGFLGGTLEQRRLTMLRSVWFTPTVEQSDSGADWFRCDVIAVAADETLGELRGLSRGVLATAAGRARYGMCGTAEPGTDGFERVICSDRHSWRAVATVPFRAGSYPGEGRVRSGGEGPCEAAGRRVADDTLDFQWGYEWPTREQWDDAQTYGICWAPA